MRTSHHSASSAGRLSSWLAVVLGLAAYVGLIYGLTLLPLQLEVPLPHWGVFAVPPVVYGLLVLAFVRRPSVLRWLLGTALLTGLHFLLAMGREPLTALLDPALAGRPLPWMLPPPLPEMVGLILLLVPLRDALRAQPRSVRDRVAARTSASGRSRAVVAPRPAVAALESGGSLTETLLPSRPEPAPEPVAAPTPAPVAPPAPAVPPPAPEEPRRRRAAARAERRREAEVARPVRRSDVVLRIALDRVMGQLPPGTFLAPEEEVAASLRDPGYLLIPGELVVTQLSEGIARVAWSDVADQFPAHLVGLGSAEISEHLGDGLRLPLDEVVGQMPHDLFVSDAVDAVTPGLERIPVPFHPLEESTPAPNLLSPPAPEVKPAPVERVRVAPPPAPPSRAAVEAVVAPAPQVRPAAPAPAAPPVEVPRPVEIVRMEESVKTPAPRPAPVPRAATPVENSEPMVRISFDRVASELPAQAFNAPLEGVAAQMRQPGVLLVPQSLVVPQLVEGLIQVGWGVVAEQFPRDLLKVSDAQMQEHLPHGIRLPLDEVIRQVPPDLFAGGGASVDVRGLENFPAPFQPLVSDPAPEAPRPAPAQAPAPVAEPAPAAAVAAPTVDVVEPEPVTIEISEPEASSLEIVPVEVPPAPAVEPTPEEPPVQPRVHVEPAVEINAPEPEPLPAPAVEMRREKPVPVMPEPEPALPSHLAVSPTLPEEDSPDWTDVTIPSAPLGAPVMAAPAETAEARRMASLLSPISSFDASVQVVEGVTVFAMAAATVAPETAITVAGLALPLLTERRAPWSLDQVTLRGPEIAVVLTPLGAHGDHGPVLAAAAPRGGGLALLEILCRRARGDRSGAAAPPAPDALSAAKRRLVPTAVPPRAAGLAPTLTAFGQVGASALRDAEGEGVLYFFLPAGADAAAVGSFAQDLQRVMRKSAGSGVVLRTAVLRSGNAFLVIQPEEIGHGRSIVVVAGGDVTRPGLAYRQVDRATATLIQA